MKLLYLLGSALSYSRYTVYIDSVFAKQESDQTTVEEEEQSAPPPSFIGAELYLTVYYNLMYTFLFAIALLYITYFVDRIKGMYTDHSNVYLSKLVQSPLFGKKYKSTNIFVRLLLMVLIHHIVVVTYLNMRNTFRKERLTKTQVKTEYLFVYCLSTVFTVLVL
jgi:hypothetical protein